MLKTILFLVLIAPVLSFADSLDTLTSTQYMNANCTNIFTYFVTLDELEDTEILVENNSKIDGTTNENIKSNVFNFKGYESTPLTKKSRTFERFDYIENTIEVVATIVTKIKHNSGSNTIIREVFKTPGLDEIDEIDGTDEEVKIPEIISKEILFPLDLEFCSAL